MLDGREQKKKQTKFTPGTKEKTNVECIIYMYIQNTYL